MDYEKKYKEALAKAKDQYNYPCMQSSMGILEEIFPEIKESEDERVRNELIEFVKSRGGFKQEYIAWLEKQESVEEIVERCKKSWYNEGKIAGMTEGLTDDEKYQQGWHDALEKQGEKKPMTEEFEHELAEICNQLLSEIDSEWMNNEILDCIGTSVWLNLCDETAKRYKDGLLKLAKQGEQKPAEWGEEDETTFKVMLEELEKYVMFKQYSTPLSVYDLQWFKSLKDRVQPQPKQEWSEEDEEAIEMAIIALEDMYDEDEPNTTYGGYNLPFNKAAERLKSLKERYICKVVKQMTKNEQKNNKED